MKPGRICTLTVAPGVRLQATDAQKRCGVHIKGFSFLALKSVCTARYGAAAVEAWAAAALVDLRNIGTSSWVPVEFYFALTEHVVAKHHGGDAREAAVIAGECAMLEINGFFRFVLSFTSPARVLGLSSHFWRQYYDRGEFTVVEAIGTRGHGEIRDWPLMSAEAAYVLTGAMLRWMETSRAGDFHFTRIEYTAPGVLSLSAEW